jgi:hypothetical protein
MVDEYRPDTIPPFDPLGGPNIAGGSKIYGDVRARLDTQSDNFDRIVANPLIDLVDVAGEKDFTPERLRYFKDDTRVFLQYGTDATFSETTNGYLLTPGSDQHLTIRTAEKASYQVGYDLWPTQAFQINNTLQSGDVVGGGYGRIDIGDFDPSVVDPDADNPASGAYTNTLADGYFWYHTVDTGLTQRLLTEVQDGTVVDSAIFDLSKTAADFTINEIRLNCYAVGPAVHKQIFTDNDRYPLDPQINDTYGAVSNDDGQGSGEFSHRMVAAIKQGAGNSGLELEAGSFGIRSPGQAEPQFKFKGHSMDLDNTNTTEGTYQAVAAMRIDTDRENVKLRFTDMTVIATPGNSTNRTRVIIQATAPENTNADDDFTFETPSEHSTSNSVLREIEVAGDATPNLVGPLEDGAGTDSTGADTANTTTNPGGFQLIRASITPEGEGTSSGIAAQSAEGNRELYPGDIGIVWIDSNTSGIHEVDISTEQNS